MRAIHANFLRGWGGQSNRVLMECVGVREAGHEVLLSVPEGSELSRRAMAAGITVTHEVGYAGGIRPGVVGDVRAFRRIVDRFQPDLIHLHGGRDSWVAAFALGLRGRATRPVILRCKHNVFPIAGHPLNRWLYGSFFDAIIGLSTAVVDQCAGTGYIRPERVTLIPSACNADRFAFDEAARKRVRDEFAVRDDEVLAVSIGRLRPEKGYDTLLAAAPAACAARRDLRFLVVGGGSLKGQLEATIAASGLQRRVTIAGFREDVPALLSAADMVVHPAVSEGLGTAVLEACAAGKPVIAGRVGGIPDVIADGETGLLVPPCDPESLAAAMLRLAADPALRARLGLAASQRVRTEFSVEALVAKTLSLYSGLVSARRG